MAKPNWKRTLSEVLKQKTETITQISEKTGNEYQIEIIPELSVYSVGSIEENDGKFKYAVVDIQNELEYSIKTTNKVEVKFGTLLQFRKVRGGELNNGNGWYSAESVAVVNTK